MTNMIVSANHLTWEVIPHGHRDEDVRYEHWHPCLQWLHEQRIPHRLKVAIENKRIEGALVFGHPYYEQSFVYSIKFRYEDHAMAYKLAWSEP